MKGIAGSKNLIGRLFPLCLCIGVLGCSALRPVEQGRRPRGGEEVVTAAVHTHPTIFHIAEGLAAQLKVNLRDEDYDACDCVVATFVDIEDLTHSSSFGRLLAEAVGAEIFRQGGRVVDIRSGNAFMVQPGEGELILSRNSRDLDKQVGVAAVVAGTYSVGATTVAVTVRLIDLSSHRVLSVAMVEMGRTPGVDALLQQSSGPVPTAFDKAY
jgi:TolB-like protein